jgi:hypothetical protein
MCFSLKDGGEAFIKLTQTGALTLEFSDRGSRAPAHC